LAFFSQINQLSTFVCGYVWTVVIRTT